jgi:hypothetical protein
MNTRKLLFYLLAGLMGGCVPVISLHPLYTKENVVFDKKLLGTWVDDPNEPDSTWRFESVNNKSKAYRLVFADDEGLQGSFTVHLLKLKEQLFLDVYPSEVPWEMDDPNESQWPYNSMFLLPTHTFLKVDSVGSKLKMRLMLDSQLEKLLEEKPDAIAHVVIEGRPVLTASTKNLQAFALEYADTDKLFTEEVVLNRKD